MIRAIETIYKGYRFRSRLEARWAVFFDSLGVPWEYEKEGYDLGEAGWYLPDFYLPEQAIWVEIKPLTDEDRQHYSDHWDWPTDLRWDAFRAGGNDLVVILGTPGIPCTYDSASPYQGFADNDSEYYWCECPSCHAIGIQFEGRSARNIHVPGCPDAEVGGRGNNIASERLVQAYSKARGARFEHGESGAPPWAEGKGK